MLFLIHAPSQTMNRQYLESYLQATAPKASALKQRSNAANESQEHVDPSEPGSDPVLLRRLNSWTIVFEVFVLRVLPSSKEWDYARRFIIETSVLEKERCAAYLQQIDILEKQWYDRNSVDKIGNMGSAGTSASEKSRSVSHERNDLPASSNLASKHQSGRRQSSRKGSPPEPLARSSPHSTIKSIMSGDSTTPSKHPKTPRGYHRISRKPTIGTHLEHQSFHLFDTLRTSLLSVTGLFSVSPLFYLRTLLFVVGLLLTLARGNFRERIQRISATGWHKIMQTVGMGVKITYM